MEQTAEQQDNQNLNSILYTSIEFVEKVNQIALTAGALILDFYNRDFEIKSKSDQSPLTEADLASHQHIITALKALTPGIPVLSEESADISWVERSQWLTYWLIDPLDGTKEFIKKNGEFTVNIALIHHGLPILGVVFAPVLDLLYSASCDIGAFKTEGASLGSQPAKISVSGKPRGGYRVMGSRSHPSEALADYLAQIEVAEVVSMGSSLKLCYVAEGKADLYPRLGPTCEWDTAAAHAIVKYAGGSCINYATNLELNYNTKDSLLNPFFIVKAY